MSRRRKKKAQPTLLLAQPTGECGPVPGWWPRDPAGDPDWVTVRSDGGGWTLGEDMSHVVQARLIPENIEVFLMGFLDDDDELWMEFTFERRAVDKSATNRTHTGGR